jgi:hypothetical protein
MTRYLLLLAGLLLTGCAVPAPVRTSGPVVEVEWVRAKSLDDVVQLCNHGLKTLQYVNISGCQWYAGARCYVVAMDYGGETLTTLGHELKHCFDGAWHSQKQNYIPPR